MSTSVELRPAEPGQPLDDDFLADVTAISESMTALMRAHGSLKARLSMSGDADVNSWFVLSKLAKLGPKRAGELADMLCADPSTVSRQVALLVKAGLVERQADPEDGRASILVLTSAGRRKVDEFVRARSASMIPVITGWTADERDIFIRLLDKYANGLDQHRDAIVSSYAGQRPPGVPTTPSERLQH